MKELGSAGVRSAGSKLPRYVLGAYCLGSLRRKTKKNNTNAKNINSAGAKVATRPAQSEYDRNLASMVGSMLPEREGEPALRFEATLESPD